MKMKTLVKPELLNLYATNSDTEKITYLKVDENISKESLIKDFKRNKPPYWLSCKKEAVCIVCDENE
ncbi:MAG: hypothetical protein J6Y89_06490, partial [Lachnospiraceae bacterium]|nr:hypothetical protein [Lachnospiraceae bacterium]